MGFYDALHNEDDDVYVLVYPSQAKERLLLEESTSIISSEESNCFSFYSLVVCQKSIAVLKEFPHLCNWHCITVW